MNKNNKPEIRFKGFTDDWEQREVSGYATFLSGNGLSWNDIDADGVQECILYGNLYTDYGMITDTINYRTNVIPKNPVYSQKGDVLIPSSDTTPTGLARATCVEKSGILLGGDINIIRPNKDINGSCLSLVINANKRELLRLIKGTTVKHIHNSDIQKIDIFLPKNKDEQFKIATYFKLIDNLITLHQRKLEKLKNIKKSMLEKMFSKNGKSLPEIRFKGFTDDWEQREVSGYATFLSGNGLSWNDIDADGVQECILYGNLYTDYGMITDTINYRTNVIPKNPVYSQKGDVLIPSSDTTPTGLARATCVEKSGILLGGDINIIRPNKDINGSCLSLVINANKRELLRLIKGTTVKHIHNSDIQKIDIFLPKNKDEQFKIATYFKLIDNLITLHQCKLEKLKNIKKSMLEKMFVK